MNKANECTCPSGDGSLVHPCPAHPAVEQAGGDERAGFEAWLAQVMSHHFDPELDLAKYEDSGEYRYNPAADYWKAWQARAALAQPSPVRSSLLINGYQLRAALDFIAPDGTAEQLESEACIEWRQQDADFLEAGLYAFCAEYPEEGSVLLDEEPTTAQPSPLQSEQAEAERPEVIRVPSCENSYGFGYVDGSCHVDLRKYRNHLEDILDSLPNDEPLMTVSQHDRIVGELRADRDSWAEQAEQRLADWDEMRKERDAALARVAELEHVLRVVVNAADHGSCPTTVMHGIEKVREVLAGSAPPAQAQHSVPEGYALIPVRETEAMHDAVMALLYKGVARTDTQKLLDAYIAAAPGKEVGHE
ncbi:hypothetical protein [Pseudomonas aeruginosa]|uniref:hypothetical protein n=1 Tax=Pseudomonas aeruginosa TaxID=287 RepID=UPI001B36B6DF|nr:hypothetical protein [Pseudomonas aeruginosa]MBP8363016.1 hypothetical protein [Pseudomonas aeruginosa]